MPQYNYLTGRMEETEEERRKREEAGTTEVGKTTVKTYADGSQTRTVTQEVPGPVAPAMDQTAYNQRIAQMESGGRPNIGFHSPASSAYGQFGITNAAYQDARRRNPNLPADITQATPEQQAQAQTAFTQANAGYLQNFGVPVNENTLAAAHFLGAKGLADFMKTGYISPQAAAANGGEENVRRIVQQRLGGQVAPASGAQQQMAGRGTMGMPQAQPEEGVAVATGQGVQGTTEVAPVSPEELQRRQQFSLSQGQGMPGLRMGTEMAAAPAASTQFINQYQSAQDDPAALLKLRGDQNVPEFIRTRAADRAYSLMNQEVQQRKAEEQAQTLAQAAASGDPRAAMTMARTLSGKPTDDAGKWLKATFMSFLKLPGYQEALADIGVGNKDQVVTDESGKSYIVTTNRMGRPVSGMSADGKALSQEQLLNVAGGAGGKLNIVGGTYVNDATGEVGRVVTDEKTGRSFIQTDSGRKPLQGFRPQSSTGTLADMRTRQMQEINLRLQGKGVEEQMRILGDYNKQLAAAGYPIVQPSEVGINVPQIGGAAPTASAPAAPAAAPSRAQQAAQALQQGAAPSAPAVPGAQPAAAAAGARPTGPQLAAQAAGEKIVGEDIGKLRTNIGTAERNADYLLTKVNELTAHPGFSVSVGASVQPGFQFIPGTDKADWYARFDEIKGQQFLQAIEQMRGTGAISDREGAEAKAAISRMNTSQSEKEFKKAAEDFQNIVRRGIDASRRKLGQEPKYGTKPESQIAAEDQAAREWLARNPNHPRAAEVRRALGQ